MSLSDLIRQAARMASRDWRAGELRLLAAALVVAVAAVTSVGFLSTASASGWSAMRRNCSAPTSCSAPTGRSTRR